ncbi:MAG: beta-galactosidase, partial [Candidatus Omnitrophica bacterium]|nr:beta-galactosidase [Candidatus Omnitrophota bacterium]
LDTIMISAPLNSLDPEVQKLILKRVENGTGLVIISPRQSKSIRYGYDYSLALSDEELRKFPESLSISSVQSYGKWKKMKEHFITTGIPFEVLKSPYSVHELNNDAEVLAEVDGKPLVVTGEYGRGRVVCINYNGMDYQHRGMAFLPEIHPFNTGSGIVVFNPDYPTFQWWEYVWSMVIKAALWASGREPELLIEKIYSDGKNVLIDLDNQRNTALFNFDITLKDGFSRVQSKKTIPLVVSKGRSHVALPLEDISGGGLHFADVIVKAGELVVNWATTNVFLPQPNSIKSIMAEKEFYIPSEKAKIGITFEKPWSEGQNLTLQGFIYDSRGCLWEETTLQVQKGAQNIYFELPLNKVPTMAFYVCVQLRKGREIVDEKRVRGIVAQKNDWDDYIYGLEVGSGSVNYYQPYWLEELRKNGVNLLKTSRMAGFGNLGYCVDSGLKIADTSRIIDTFLLHGRQQEYQQLKTNYFKTAELKYLIRPVCFNDPKYRDEVQKRIQLVVGLIKGYGALDYTLTDELSITHFGDAYDFCFCEHCIKAFQEWVRPQYKSLEELNQAYGTDFASWEQIRPITAKEAREKGKWSGWADHRRFNEESLAEFVRWVRSEIKKIQPEATISLSGTQIPGPYNGHDVWLRTQVFDNLWAYGSGNQLIMHHFFNPSFKQIPWGGYGSSGPSLKHKIWENVFEGGHGNCFWWFPINLDPDFTTNPCSASWNEAVEDLLKGIGKTIFASTLEDYGVAIYYSQSSVHAGYVLDASSTLEANRNAWVEILKKNQISPSFISYGQVEQGKLAYPEVRVLILPYTISLSEGEADAIRKFVASGGTVIADMQTGIMDQHCRPYKTGILDDVFGISRAGFDVSPVLENGEWNSMKDWNFTLDMPVLLQEPSISVKTGYALYRAGKTPGIIVNSYGKGRAWYLNFNLSKLESLRKKSQDKILLNFMKELLNQSGIKPLVNVVDDKGNIDDECQVFVYKLESAYFVGLLPDITFQNGSQEKKAKLMAPSGYQVFDMRNKMPVNSEEITLKPGIAHFYSLLPYSVEDIQVKIPSEVKPGGTVNVLVSLTTKGKQPSNHVIRIEFYNPEGKEIYWYSKNLVSSKGKVEYRILLPLNAEPGKWSVLIRDLPSGTKKIQEFEVKS